MTEAFVTPEIITWARDRLHWNHEKLAKRVGVNVDTVIAWETGDKHPSQRQAAKLAAKLCVPLGYLWLSAPPALEVPIPDLRTVSDVVAQPPSANFMDVLYDARRKQQWYREYVQSEGARPLPFVGRFPLKDDPRVNDVAGDMRATIGIDDARQEAKISPQFLHVLAEKAGSMGILVLQSGKVGNNTHRTLDVDEFRGFALVDDFAPLVFINSADTLAARIFTLAHELTHVWIGESGISNPTTIGIVLQEDNRINQFCNQVAAELLMPAANFVNEWQQDKTIEENIAVLARFYHVSRLAVLIRAYEHELLPEKVYRLQLRRLRQWEEQKPTGGGGNFWNNFLASNSRALVYAVLTSAAEGRVSERDAATLLSLTNRRTLRSAQERYIRRQVVSAWLLA